MAMMGLLVFSFSPYVQPKLQVNLVIVVYQSESGRSTNFNNSLIPDPPLSNSHFSHSFQWFIVVIWSSFTCAMVSSSFPDYTKHILVVYIFPGGVSTDGLISWRYACTFIWSFCKYPFVNHSLIPTLADFSCLVKLSVQEFVVYQHLMFFLDSFRVCFFFSFALFITSSLFATFIISSLLLLLWFKKIIPFHSHIPPTPVGFLSP